MIKLKSLEECFKLCPNMSESAQAAVSKGQGIIFIKSLNNAQFGMVRVNDKNGVYFSTYPEEFLIDCNSLSQEQALLKLEELKNNPNMENGKRTEHYNYLEEYIKNN